MFVSDSDISDDKKHQEDEFHQTLNHPRPSNAPNTNNTGGNPGLRLLDACFDDVGYARYLLQSKLPSERIIKNKVNWKDQSSGVSILHCLAYSDLDVAIKLLLQYNAEVNIKNNNDETPLHWCAKMNNTKSAKVLLDHNADVNSLDQCKSSPLHYAAAAGNLEIVALLLDRDADVQLIDSENNTAIELSAEGKSIASKAITVMLLRMYNKRNILLPKNVKAKVQFSMDAHNIVRQNSAFTINTSMLENNTSSNNLLLREKPSNLNEVSIKPPKTLYDQFKSGEMAQANARSNRYLKEIKDPNKVSNSKYALSKPPEPVLVSSNSPPSTPDLRRHTIVDSVGIEFDRKKLQIPQFVIRKADQNTSTSPQSSPIRKPPISRSLTEMNPHKSKPLIDISKDSLNPGQIDDYIREKVGDVLDRLQIPSPKSQFSGRGRRVMSASEIISTKVTPLVPPVEKPKINEVPKQTPSSFHPDQSGLPKTLAEEAFPPASFVPFLPSPNDSLDDFNPGHLDIIIAVEHCADCHTHNDQSLRHDPIKYVSNANNVLYELIQTLVRHRYAIRLYALRCKAFAATRIGAFEVTAAIRLNFPSKEQLKGQHQSDTKAPHSLNSRWATHTLFSKLSQKSWPVTKSLQQKLMNFIDVTMKDAISHHQNDIGASLAMELTNVNSTFYEYKWSKLERNTIADIQNNYQSWIERMKIPPIVHRDPMDLDWPELMPQDNDEDNSSVKLSNASILNNYLSNGKDHKGIRHSPGPYLDLNLAQMVPQLEFDRSSLEHFLVFDARFGHLNKDTEDNTIDDNL